jgi:hypothetical protein
MTSADICNRVGLDLGGKCKVVESQIMAEPVEIEYIVIAVSEGFVQSISPQTPQSTTLLKPEGQGAKIDIGVALNKMAEYGFRLMSGAPIYLLHEHPSKVNYIVFMERTK